MRKFFILTILGLLMSVAMVWAQGGLETAGQISGLDKTKISETGSIPSAVGLILGQALLYLGIIFFLLIVYAGFLWMTASGQEKQVDKAKGILISAVAGLVIVVSAYAITNFIFGRLLTQTTDTAIVNKCVTNETYIFANCQQVGTACEYNGKTGDYIEKLCPGGENIQCCVVQK